MLPKSDFMGFYFVLFFLKFLKQKPILTGFDICKKANFSLKFNSLQVGICKTGKSKTLETKNPIWNLSKFLAFKFFENRLKKISLKDKIYAKKGGKKANRLSCLLRIKGIIRGDSKGVGSQFLQKQNNL